MMDVSTPYELKIPTDSITLIETAGILGERYVAIDISQASGPPIEDYGCLKSKPTQASTADDNFLNALDVDKFLKALDRRVENIKASRTDDNAPKDDLPSPSREKKR
jgi:ABC-type transporter Mla subunit MlaD